MNNKTFGIARVSSKDQNLDRQIVALKEFGVQERDIYCDKISGSRECMESRVQYNLLKQNLRKGDLLVIPSLDRLSRDYQVLKNEWEILTKEIGVDIVVLNMSLLDTRTNKDLMGTFISDLVIQILAFFSQNERQYIRDRQKSGIEAMPIKNGKRISTKTGNPIGRPKIERPINFEEIITRWKNKEITGKEAKELLGVKNNTFYEMIKNIN